MRLAPEVTIQPLSRGGEGDEPERSAVLLQGLRTGEVVSGCVLEAAVESDGHFLLFLTDDTPYEDLLHLHLLDARGHLLDSADLGGPYTTGRFSGPQLLGDGLVGFGFIDDKDWQVQLLPAPRLRLPLLSEPKGVWRSKPLRCHFLLQARPRAAATP